MKKALVGIVCSLMVFLSAGSAFAETQCTRVALTEALAAMVSDSEVAVTQVPVPVESSGPWSDNQTSYYYTFEPVDITPQDGFIIYPGGDVDEKAYAVLAREIAKAGFLVALVPMPNCVVIGAVDRAEVVITNNPGIDTWAIGGHSFGGVGACWYVYNGGGAFTNSSKIKGIVLWAGWVATGQPIDDKQVKVISLWGTQDGVATEEETTNAAVKAALPDDTDYIGIEGANHSQFGYYGEDETDKDYLDTDDNPPGISRETQHELLVSYTVNFLDSLTADTDNIPAAVAAKVTAEDGSKWEKVSLHGFVDPNNTEIVALTPYEGNLYALTRNDVSGFELWKTNPAGGWQRIHVQGFTDQSDFYGYMQHPDVETANLFDFEALSRQYNPNMNIWADMIEFKGHLYVAVSTGYQGSALFGSQGALMWRTDGVAWEPVIGGHEPYAQGTLSTISGCNGSSATAVFADDTGNWTDDLTGCIVEVESEFSGAITGGDPEPGRRLFKVVSNTATTLTVEQNEKANRAENAECSEFLTGGGDMGRPRNNQSGFIAGAAYSITCDDPDQRSQGFGDPWNKSIIDFEILDNVLYASIGLNYELGARIMRTSDGMTWVADAPYSFGLIHGVDWNDGSTIPDEECVYGNKKGAPVSSSLTKMLKTEVAGQDTLLIGGTGTSGCNGRGARIYRRDGDQVWTPIVDALVDENDNGTNENGFGYDSGGDFFYSAFQAWSWVEYDSNIIVGVAKLEGGGMIFSSPDASNVDGTWAFSMGGQSADRPKDTDPKVPGTAYSSDPDPAFNGFGDVLNTGVLFHNYTDQNNQDIIYAGTLVTNLSLYYLNELNGADLWKGSGAGDSVVWTRVVSDGFGDNTVLSFASFTDYDTEMYMAASTVNPSDFRGQEPENYTGAVVYRLAEEAPECLQASTCFDDGNYCSGDPVCTDGECGFAGNPCMQDQMCDETADSCVECLQDSDCSEGFECVDGACELVNNPPVFLSEPRWPYGYWPIMSSDPANPNKPLIGHELFFAYDDDGNCQGIAPEKHWMYRPVELQEGGGVLPLDEWTIEVPDWSFMYWVLMKEPTIAEITGPGLFELKISVTDCMGQTTDTEGFYGKRYYIQVN